MSLNALEFGLDALDSLLSTDGTVTTILGPSGSYIRIGNANTTTNSLNSEDDLVVTGKLEVNGTIYLDGLIQFAIFQVGLRINEDQPLSLGNEQDAAIRYRTIDSDARCVLFSVDESLDSGRTFR